MENSIILQNLDSDSLKSLIQEAVRMELAAVTPKKEDSYLTRKEIAGKLRISLPSLDKAVKDGKVKGYRINGRVLFKESELLLSEIPIRKRR